MFKFYTIRKPGLIFFITLFIIYFCIFYTPHTYASNFRWIPELDLDYSGKIYFDTIFSNVFGNQTDFIVQNSIPTPWGYDYFVELYLEGYVGSLYLDSSLYYPSNAEMDFYLTMENESWIIGYHPFELKIPTLKTTFNTQKLEGMEIHRLNESLQLFSGVKLYQTKTQTFSVFTSQPVYTLFEDPTSGDVVEYSEIVLLDGKQLERYMDYKINYLSGEVKFLIPLEYGSVIKVKYNFLPTGDKVNDMLKGGYLQYNFQNSPNSYLALFYFNEMNEILVQNDLSLEPVQDIKHTTYLGTTANFTSAPWGISGEIAFSNPWEDKYEYAGNLNLTYSTPEGNLEYQLTSATPQFNGIGVVPNINGEKHHLTSQLNLHPDWMLDLGLSRVTNKNDFGEKITQQANLGINYQLNDSHTFSIILDSNSTEEWGDRITDYDCYLGWEYKITDQINLAIKESIKEPEKGSLSFSAKGRNYRFTNEYTQYLKYIPFYGHQWLREFNSDLTFRPWTGFTFISDVDYLQPFDKSFTEAQKRMALTLIASANQNLNTRSNFIYFYNPNTEVKTLFYDLSSSIVLPGAIELNGAAERIQLDSPVLTNTDQSWNGKITIPFMDKLSLAYGMDHDVQKVFLKQTNMVSQNTDIFTKTVTLDYSLNECLTLSLNRQWRDNLWVVASSTSKTREKEFGLGIVYIENMHVKNTHAKKINHFEYKISHLNDRIKNELTHSLNWQKSIGNLSFIYAGKLNHLLQEKKVTHHKEFFELIWDDPSIVYKPSFVINYQRLNKEGEFWENYNLSGKLSYELDPEKKIFAQIGQIVNKDYFNSVKNYRSCYLKSGIEYSF